MVMYEQCVFTVSIDRALAVSVKRRYLVGELYSVTTHVCMCLRLALVK
jgi:hypothetical protein